MTWDLDNYPLAEEIGDPDLFVGREKEMTRLLRWADGTKRLHSKSMGILSRRKKGKTALLQRFFNVLYTRNDPQLIPFYYRIPENLQTKSDFTESFYRRTLTQYFACTTRTPKWVRTVLSMDALKELAASDEDLAEDIRNMEDMLARAPTSAWPFAQEAAHRISQVKDVRILQILDEFQYMNKYIVSDHPERVELLCHSYMGAAESKFSPQIVAGSYIGWLGAILQHMTARYRDWRLEGLADDEAVEAVYNYARVFQVRLTDETAPYVAEVCDNDPFYIAATVSNLAEMKDLTTREGVQEALTLETVPGKGDIARTWIEYLRGAFDKVNDKNARKIVLYLAAREPEERDRNQIRADLGLDMTEQQLEERLHQLVMADILAEGSTNFHYQGLGDRIFAMVFRRIYGAEIENVTLASIEDDFKEELDSARREAARYRGQAAENRVRYRLQAASLAGADLADIVTGEPPAEGFSALGPFVSIRKAHFHLDLERHVEADLHAVSAGDDGADLIVEVKDWEKKPTAGVVRRFIEAKGLLDGHLEKKTWFLFYSESGLGKDAAAMLAEAGILLVDPVKLASFEMPSTRF